MENLKTLETKRTAADKVLRDKVFNIDKNTKYDGYRKGFASMVYNFFDKKFSGSGIKNENMSNKALAIELHKPITRKFEEMKIHSSFIDNIWDADLSDMQLLSKCNKGIRFLLSVINTFRKYSWVIPLKDRKVITITNAFRKILDESICKPRKYS